jgi:hypothetical protein
LVPQRLASGWVAPAVIRAHAPTFAAHHLPMCKKGAEPMLYSALMFLVIGLVLFVVSLFAGFVRRNR